MDYIFHPKAAQDAREIEAQYAEVSEELAARFWSELNDAIDDVFAYPERQHFDPSGYRRKNLNKFPFHILFEQREHVIRIMIVRHHRRSPQYGLRRR